VNNLFAARSQMGMSLAFHINFAAISMTPVNLLAGAILLGLVVYSLLAGADYGARFWDLMCRGPRQEQQRHLIEQALGTVWEANHVWLILSIVLLFSGFPEAFGALCVALAIPLFLILLGIVLRGCSFVFRSYFKRINAVDESRFV
jgi:cytochrome d ubiquinol oxidase subunit II